MAQMSEYEDILRKYQEGDTLKIKVRRKSIGGYADVEETGHGSQITKQMRSWYRQQVICPARNHSCLLNKRKVKTMKYIETLHEGERLSGIYLCKYRQSAMTKNGKSYENVILQDKTGVIDAKIWDPNSQGIEDFDMLDYIDVVGDVTSFQGALQVSIKRVRKAREGEYIEEDYLPVSERNIDEMYESCSRMCIKSRIRI